MPAMRYQLHTNNLVLDNEERKYVLKIRDLPTEEKPREKLLKHGPSALSTPELLAVLLSAGTKKEEIMTMANRIMKDYGPKSLMSQRDATKLSEDLDIPLGKAMQIIACAELGERFFMPSTNQPIIRTARQVYEYTKSIRELPKEHLQGIYLNAHYRVIHDEIISIGTIDANIIHPREVFKPALQYSAAAVILAHNHPSGIARPSKPDIEITEQLIEAGRLLGIDLIDHVIVTKHSFASIPASYRQ